MRNLLTISRQKKRQILQKLSHVSYINSTIEMISTFFDTTTTKYTNNRIRKQKDRESRSHCQFSSSPPNENASLSAQWQALHIRYEMFVSWVFPFLRPDSMIQKDCVRWQNNTDVKHQFHRAHKENEWHTNQNPHVQEYYGYQNIQKYCPHTPQMLPYVTAMMGNMNPTRVYL